MILTAYKGRDGTVTIPIESDPLGGNNYVDLSLSGARVEFDAITSAIDTDGVNAEITGNAVTFKLGALDLTQGVYSECRIVLYNNDYPEGKTIAGPGYDIVTLNYFE
ncbi:MAG: hypothetical protein ACI9T9_000766 [Oleiphilaceae bacterium]|jgi:hypothetical protein